MRRQRRPRERARVKHIVKLSSMGVQQGLAIGAWHKRGEAAVRASGVPFSFVQPTGFRSNLLAWAPSIKTEGVVRASTGAGRRAFIHPDDIAAVVEKALTTRAYEGKSLPITGPLAGCFRHSGQYEVAEQVQSRGQYRCGAGSAVESYTWSPSHD